MKSLNQFIVDGLGTLTKSTLKELIVIDPNALVIMKLALTHMDHRIVVPADEALVIINQLEANDFKDGYVRDMGVVDLFTMKQLRKEE